ncbi:MAG: helix-turn-helix transcriptional regulator, partial [Pseudonocardia sp.]
MSEPIDDAKRTLGHALARLRAARGWTQERLAASTFVHRSYVAHAEAGRVIPNERFWTDADAALGAGGALISGFERFAATRDRATRETAAGSGPAPAGNAGAGSAGANRSTRDVADESLAFANRAAASNLSDVTVEHLRWEVNRLAIAYVHVDLPPVFVDLVAARDEMFGLLNGHQRPRHTRELYFLTGATCLMLAQASRNLGDPRAELAQLRCAWTCVDRADHPGLRAWAQGTAALHAESSGQPRRAMTLADEARGAAGSRGSRVRLAAVRARAAA